MLSIIATLIYDCCFGLKQKPERKSTRELINALEEQAEEELGKTLSYLMKQANKRKFSCC